MTNNTKREYYNYSSNEPVQAEIIEIRRFQDVKPPAEESIAVILDRTIFYPEGGGQPADHGTVNGLPLLDVRDEHGEILHIMADNAVLELGKAELVLDSRRRRDFTVTHTGQHLLSGVLFRYFNIPTKSAHLGEDICFIDIECPDMDEKTILETEDKITDIIEENRKVITHLCPPEDVNSFQLRKLPPKGENVIRIIEIEGLDFSPCCGTHLESTGGIGMLRILDAEKYKGMIRLGFITGRRCLFDSRCLRKNAEAVSRALSVPINETGKGVIDYIKKAAELEQQVKTLKEEAAQTKAEALVAKTGFEKKLPDRTLTIIIELYKTDMNEILNIGKKAQKSSDAVFVLVSETENKFAAFCSSKDIDIRRLVKEKLDAHNGKGGGGPSFFQGSFSNKNDLAQFLEEVTVH